MPFLDFLNQFSNAIGSTLRAVGDSILNALVGLAKEISNAITGVGSAIQTLANATATVIEGVVKWVGGELQKLTSQITQLGEALRRVDFRVAERAHQYQQARLNRNPLGVLGESLQIFTERSGPPDLVNPAQGAPWVTVPQTVKEIQAFWADGAHPVRVSLQTALDDFAAIVAGQARDLGPWPRRVTDLPGLADLPDTGLAAPDVESMLNPEDNTLVGKTTRGRL